MAARDAWFKLKTEAGANADGLNADGPVARGEASSPGPVAPASPAGGAHQP